MYRPTRKKRSGEKSCSSLSWTTSCKRQGHASLVVQLAVFCLISYHLKEVSRMLILGHTGITLGMAALLSSAFSRSCSPPAKMNGESQSIGQSVEPSDSQNGSVTHRPSWLTYLSIHIDIRVLLIGSLLPDIIDKPVGLLFFSETLSNGRIFCHTLLFFILMTIAGLYLYRSHGRWR